MSEVNFDSVHTFIPPNSPLQSTALFSSRSDKTDGTSVTSEAESLANESDDDDEEPAVNTPGSSELSFSGSSDNSEKPVSDTDGGSSENSSSAGSTTNTDSTTDDSSTGSDASDSDSSESSSGPTSAKRTKQRSKRAGKTSIGSLGTPLTSGVEPTNSAKERRYPFRKRQERTDSDESAMETESGKIRKKKLATVHDKSEHRPKQPKSLQRQMVRLAALYLVPVLLVIPLSLLLSLNTVLLTPLYNSLPLTLHTPSLDILYSLPPSFLYWAITLHIPAKQAVSANVCLSLAALSGDAVAIWGRRVGSLMGRVGGGEWGAWGARGLLGMGAVGGNVGFALLCFDYISPIGPAATQADQIRNLVNVFFRTVVYMLHVGLGQGMWDKVVARDSSMLTQSPEKSILFISLLFTTLSLFLRSPVASSHSATFPAQLQALLLRTINLSPSSRAKVQRLTELLPRRALLLILFLRLPLLILALRQQIFLRPGSAEQYVTAHGELRVLSSQQSITGRIVVAENLRDGYRFLRCDHSILGGRWIREREKDGEKKVEMGDSIFAVFNMQEVVMLAHRSDSKESTARTLGLTTDLEVSLEGDEDVGLREPDRTLIIGLGVGISAQGFLKQGHQVDVVEIDPLVFSAATEHFDLSQSSLSSVNLMDGASFISQLADLARTNTSDPLLSAEDLATVASVPRWDFVVQDCFTGGTVPGEMFTLEFWQDLRELIVDDGIVAMNFVGLKKSKASRAVLVTLLSVFPQCRAFKDGTEGSQKPNDIINMVVFCTKTYSPLLTFRRPRPSDVRRSPLRSHVYSTFLRNEIYLDEIVAQADLNDKELVLRRRDTGRLNRWQRPTAVATWRAMQQILTPAMWLAY